VLGIGSVGAVNDWIGIRTPIGCFRRALSVRSMFGDTRATTVVS
jgi:hypothetical protein